MQKIIIALVALAAGYGLTFLFPEKVEVEKRVEVTVEKQIVVEKPVEKIVEKIVEVPVTKVVEVPARLTKEQENLLADGRSLKEARTLPDSCRVVGPREKAVKVIIDMSDDAKARVDEKAIKARIETAFRNCGFKLVEHDHVDTVIHAQAQLIIIETNQEIGLAGTLSINTRQYLTAKIGWFGMPQNGTPARFSLIAADLDDYAITISSPRSSYSSIPSKFDDLAVTAANDLMKAYERDQASASGVR